MVCDKCSRNTDFGCEIEELAQTALAYREMLEKIIDHKNEADKMYLYAEKAEKMLKKSKVEEG